MKKIDRRLGMALGSVALLLALGACSPGAETEQAAQKAADATKVAGNQAAAELKDAGARAAQVTTEAAGKISEKLDDATISLKVTTGLAADKNLSASRIQVRTHEGVVTLKGPAPSAAARERATEIARNVKGVTSVNNQLSVQSG
jgi:osmotically-inducible protein OsmY